jgi:uncharacterized protein with HEPN domain
MTEDRLDDYLSQITTAAEQALTYVEGLDLAAFLGDTRTQQAVVLNLIIIGEAAARLSNVYPEFAQAHSEVPWAQMRGMRNRIAHGYFEIDQRVVWETVENAIPDLLTQIRTMRASSTTA